MQGVNVFENGIGYLFKCLSLYTGGTAFFVMFLLCLIVLILKGSRRERELFLPPSALLLVTVCNPLVPVVLDRIFDVASEYYRLFWIFPVIILVPYVFAKLILSSKGPREAAATVAVIVLCFVLGGNFVYADGFEAAQNVYRIDDELAEISSKIHEDSGTEYTKAFFEYGYNMEIRQYDPKMLLCVNREQYLYAVSYSYTDEMLADENAPVNRILARLVRNQRVSYEDFKDALEATGTKYVVLSAGHPQSDFVVEAGLLPVAATDSHVIYRYDLKEDKDWQLVDYSEAEHRFSWRRIK